MFVHLDWVDHRFRIFKTNQPVFGNSLQTNCEDSVMRCEESNLADKISRSQSHAMCFQQGVRRRKDVLLRSTGIVD